MRVSYGEIGRQMSMICLILIVSSGGIFSAAPPARPGWRAKVHPLVLNKMAKGPVDFLLYLDEQADLTTAVQFKQKRERGRFVVETLRETAARSQSRILAGLDKRGLDYTPFWIVNMVRIRGRASDVAALAAREDVRRIDANPIVKMELPESLPEGSTLTISVESNIQQIRADQVWALGFTGQGVVVSGHDTGYEWDHPALIQAYRGWDGATASHDHNWHDAIHAGVGPCLADALVPCDDHGHGTHTMGTMIGDDGDTNQIGMAPGARWIGCRNMDQGNGTPATYTECFQWLVAPTDLMGMNPHPSLAPDIINNSWACPLSEGCSPDTLRAVVENTRAAGILVVVSAGNGGDACESISNPPAIYDASFSVGATDSSDAIASFSSRGPVTVDGSGRLKPDLSAPGVSVRSSVRGATYQAFSGTSMAGPHVAGVAALLLSARPDLAGNVDDLETILRQSTVGLTTIQDCGVLAGSEVPNNTFGHGRIDALAAIQGDADGDGVDNLNDCLPVQSSAWAAPGPVTNLSLLGAQATQLAWDAPPDPGALAPIYDVLRSGSPSDLSGSICLASSMTLTTSVDTEIPSDIFFYLVRVHNVCGSTLGATSGGVDRLAPTCP